MRNARLFQIIQKVRIQSNVAVPRGPMNRFHMLTAYITKLFGEYFFSNYYNKHNSDALGCVQDDNLVWPRLMRNARLFQIIQKVRMQAFRDTLQLHVIKAAFNRM